MNFDHGTFLLNSGLGSDRVRVGRDDDGVPAPPVLAPGGSDGSRHRVGDARNQHTGVLAGIPSTGKPYRIRGASVGQRNGEAKIASNRDYSNLADYLTQVGLFTTPP